MCLFFWELKDFDVQNDVYTSVIEHVQMCNDKRKKNMFSVIKATVMGKQCMTLY